MQTQTAPEYLRHLSASEAPRMRNAASEIRKRGENGHPIHREDAGNLPNRLPNWLVSNVSQLLQLAEAIYRVNAVLRQWHSAWICSCIPNVGESGCCADGIGALVEGDHQHARETCQVRGIAARPAPDVQQARRTSRMQHAEGAPKHGG